MIPRSLSLFTYLLVGTMLLVACGSDSTLPTLRPTVDTGNVNATVDPNLGSGFDPNLGGEDNNDNNIQPTPTRESDSSMGSDIESGARGTGFTAQITGGSIPNIADGGQYACSLTGHRIASGNNPAPNIIFIIPITNTVGTHTFSGTADAVAVQISLASVDDSYNQVTGGTLTIDKIPKGAGDFVSGSFDFTIRNETGTEIGVRGSFDFESGDTAYCS